MTIERPMFPPVADCQIIQFSAARLSAKRLDEINASARAIVASVHQIPTEPTEPIFVRRVRPLPEPLTDTCRNHRLRLTRRDAWCAARRLTATGAPAWIGNPHFRLHNSTTLPTPIRIPKSLTVAKIGGHWSIYGAPRL
jgi:hypothetical protein